MALRIVALTVRMVQRQVEGVEVAPAARRVDARAMRRLTISGTRCSEMPPCERSGASSADRSWRAAAVPITVKRSETTTRSPMRSAGSSKRSAAAARVSTSFDAAQRGDALDQRGARRRRRGR